MAGGRAKKSRIPKQKLNQKRNRWAKGQSSSSNPETNKFRLAAKTGFFQHNAGQGNLTTEALAKHDEAQREFVGRKDSTTMETEVCDGDIGSIGAKTFESFATNVTQCTNPSFNRILQNFQLNSSLHKDMLAVLAAVTELIKAQKGKETETEYFAALMLTLDTVSNPDALAACVTLIGMVIKRLPPPVRKVKFSESSKIFLDLILKHLKSENSLLIKGLIGCLSVLLRSQDFAVWEHPSTQHMYQEAILKFTVFSKPKIRKAAHHAVCAILKGSTFMLEPNAPSHHPAAVQTATYCIQGCKDSKDTTSTLHMINLMKDILSILPKASIKACCECILHLMTIGNVVVTSCSMQALHGMFLSHPKPSSLTPELNAQLIMALYDHQPSINDTQPLIAWISVMQEAQLNLYRIDEKLCITHLPHVFETAAKCWLSDRSEVLPAVTSMLRSLLYQIIQPVTVSFEQVDLLSSNSTKKSTLKCLEEAFASVENSLKFQYHGAWDQVLHILAVFFEVCGKYCQDFMTKCLQTLADKRESPKFSYNSELDFAVGMAVRSMGPKIVLSSIPLQITGDEDNTEFPRSWILPVVRDNVRDTELAFFTSYFLPLAHVCKNQADKMSKENRNVEATAYNLIQSQIWSTFVGFCTRPTDLSVAFKDLAKHLGGLLNNRPDLRLDIMAGLRLLINKNLENEANRNELAKYAKNYLPIFFNLYTVQPVKGAENGVRLAVFETIKVYLQITNAEICQDLFSKAFKKLEDSNVQSFIRHGLLDITQALLPYLDVKRIEQLFTLCVTNMQESDLTLQKKTYRVLDELCAGRSEACQEFVDRHLPNMQDVLLKAVSTQVEVPAIKAVRLRCLTHILKLLPNSACNRKFITALVPEVILCVREPSERARASASTLLLEIGTALIRWNPDKLEKEVLREFVDLLLAGLVGSPKMISATIFCLSYVMHEMKAYVTGELLQLIIRNLCLLLTSRSREVVQAVLEFLKLLLSGQRDTMLAQFVEEIVRNLVSMPDDCKKKYRFKSREVFAKLIKKFGFEMISKFVPETERKMLVNIRKMQERQRRKRAQKDAEQQDEDGNEEFSLKAKTQSIEELLKDSDSEPEVSDDNSSKAAANRKLRRTHIAAWIHESGEGPCIDFLDPKAAHSITATKPDKDQKRDDLHGFKMTGDGKLIIAEESDQKQKSKIQDKPTVEDVEDVLQALAGPSKKQAVKRKFDDASDEEIESNPVKYQAGGSGIHRPIAIPKRKPNADFGTEYRSKKAGGDMKKPGKPDPFAYVPLNIASLNKRKQAKLSGQFKGLVKAARKGARKGSTSKNRFKKSRNQ